MSARNCVECSKPPGGRVCCDDGLTPICLIKDGRTEGLCRMISSFDSGSAYNFATAIADDVAAFAGEEYRDEFVTFTSFAGGIFSFASLDGRVRMTAKPVTSESGTRLATVGA